MSCLFENYRDFMFAIIEEAVEDYKFLKENDLDEIELYDRSRISKREIEKFFRSEWCDLLLASMKFTGEDILRYLNRE